MQKLKVDIERKDKKIQEQEDLIQGLQKYNTPDSQAHSDSSEEIKRLKEEILRLQSLNKNRTEMLQQIDTKDQNLRETETKLKMTQNDF